MSALLGSIAAVTAAAGIAIGVAGPAAALPQCGNTAPMTTQCERPGNTQIHTAPSASAPDYPLGWPWWGNGGIALQLGRGYGPWVSRG